MELKKLQFADLLIEDKGLMRGPFGGAIKKEFFVPKGPNTYKVYEQGVIYNRDCSYGSYYIDEKLFNGLKRFEVKTGDILLSGAGTLGELYEMPDNIERGIINQALIRLRVNENVVDKEYFKYYFNWYIKIVACQQVGASVIPNLPPLEVLKKIDVFLPSLATQKRISSVLSNLDRLISLKRAENSTLEAMAKEIYDYWFVQFDFPDKDGKPYKSSGGKMVFNEILKREIPEGWEVKRLGEVADTFLGGTPSTTNQSFWDGNVPWLNSGEVAEFPIVKSEKTITEEAIKKSATILLPAGSVTYSITRYLRASILAIDACINQSVIGIKENCNIKNSFLYPFLRNETPNLMLKRTGAQQPHINKDIFDNTCLALPDNNTLDKYYNRVILLYDLIINTANQIQSLTSLRDYLLPLLMNGQVEVKEAEEKFQKLYSEMAMVAEPECKFGKRKSCGTARKGEY